MITDSGLQKEESNSYKNEIHVGTISTFTTNKQRKKIYSNLVSERLSDLWWRYLSDSDLCLGLTREF